MRDHAFSYFVITFALPAERWRGSFFTFFSTNLITIYSDNSYWIPVCSQTIINVVFLGILLLWPCSLKRHFLYEPDVTMTDDHRLKVTADIVTDIKRILLSSYPQSIHIKLQSWMFGPFTLEDLSSGTTCFSGRGGGGKLAVVFARVHHCLEKHSEALVSHYMQWSILSFISWHISRAADHRLLSASEGALVSQFFYSSNPSRIVSSSVSHEFFFFTLLKEERIFHPQH